MKDVSLRLEEHLTIEEPGTPAASHMADKTGLSRQRIKQAMQKGAVWLTRGKRTQRLRRATTALKTGDTLHLYYDERVLSMAPTPPELIADEQAYSVWYKPRGMLSQGSKWGDHCTLVRWVEQHLTPQRPAFLVHRLDRAATGLMLIAHRKRSAAALSALFQERTVEKRYRALVRGRAADTPDPLLIDSPLDEREAISHVTLVSYDSDNDCSVVNVHIETGRKHQIRRHLASIGHSVVGDRLYGNANSTQDLQLMACELAFHCPVTDSDKRFRLSDDLMRAGVTASD